MARLEDNLSQANGIGRLPPLTGVDLGDFLRADGRVTEVPKTSANLSIDSDLERCPWFVAGDFAYLAYTSFSDFCSVEYSVARRG